MNKICKMIGATEETGFLAIKNGIEYCWFDYVSLMLFSAIVISFIIILYSIMREKRRESK